MKKKIRKILCKLTNHLAYLVTEAGFMLLDHSGDSKKLKGVDFYDARYDELIETIWTYRLGSWLLHRGGELYDAFDDTDYSALFDKQATFKAIEEKLKENPEDEY